MGDSLLVRLARLGGVERGVLLGELGGLGVDPAFLLDDWRVLARPEQLPPLGGWSTWVFGAGRGAGKTRAAAEWVHDRVLGHFAACRVHNSDTAHKVALGGRSAGDMRDVMVEGPSGVLAVSERRGLRALYEPSKKRVSWPDLNASATLYSSEEPDASRGSQHHTLWADELAAWRVAVDDAGVTAWTNLKSGLRGTIPLQYKKEGVGDVEPQAMVTTTPKRISTVKELWRAAEDPSDTGVVMTTGSTMDNAANLALTFLDEMFERYKGTRLEAQELLGRLLDNVEGALWSDWMIEQSQQYMGQEMPSHNRPVVALDCSVADRRSRTSTWDSQDEYGIIVAAKLANPLPERRGQCVTVLEDNSGSGSPQKWAQATVDTARRHHTNLIIAERNQGGQMIEQIIHNIDPGMRIHLVHATHSKQTRAEPVSHLYEQRRVIHAERYEQLCEELTSWVPGDTHSPGRLDALVWAITHLIPEITRPPSTLHTPHRQPHQTGHNPWATETPNFEALQEAQKTSPQQKRQTNIPLSITDRLHGHR